MDLTDQELDALAIRLAPLLADRLMDRLAPRDARNAEPIPHKLTVEQFAFCVERSAYTINEDTRLDPKLRKFVQGQRPKLIHPAALALYGVDQALAASRLALWSHKSAA